jgi:hypothetical protein
MKTAEERAQRTVDRWLTERLVLNTRSDITPFLADIAREIAAAEARGRAAIRERLDAIEETGPSDGVVDAGLDAIYHPGEMRDYARESFHAIISAALTALIKELE